jgi:hypothetical protein
LRWVMSCIIAITQLLPPSPLRTIESPALDQTQRRLDAAEKARDAAIKSLRTGRGTRHQHRPTHYAKLTRPALPSVRQWMGYIDLRAATRLGGPI